MKWNYNLSLIMIGSLAIILPLSAFGQEQKQDEKKQGTNKGSSQQHGSKAASQGTTHHTSASSGGKSTKGSVHNTAKANNTSTAQSHVGHVSKGSAKVNQSNASQATSQSSQSSNRSSHKHSNTSQVTSQSSQSGSGNHSSHNNQQNQAQGSSNNNNNNQQAYNRSNNYGGLWSAGNTHPNWNRNGQYYWNNHNYRWYDGGWLIIGEGFSPNYSYSNGDYSNGGSMVSNIQSILANQGYYHGPIDGDMGPGTSNAIAGYQNDHNLRVTGQINNSLLQSLQSE